ncbi:hypothetical protein HDU96_006168 [Phlyctochytrium bullatum]|nr:hypothetical protein HDU96_006168 [Phlyctochytrium bullatum]
MGVSSVLAIIATASRGWFHLNSGDSVAGSIEYGFFSVKACGPDACYWYDNPCAGNVPRSFRSVCGMSQWKGAQACLVLSCIFGLLGMLLLLLQLHLRANPPTSTPSKLNAILAKPRLFACLLAATFLAGFFQFVAMCLAAVIRNEGATTVFVGRVPDLGASFYAGVVSWVMAGLGVYGSVMAYKAM